MKRLLFIFVFILLFVASNAQTPYYYYYEGKKQYLSLNTGYAFLSVKEQQLPSDIELRNINTTELRPDGSDKKQYQGQKRSHKFQINIYLCVFKVYVKCFIYKNLYQ